MNESSSPTLLLLLLACSSSYPTVIRRERESDEPKSNEEKNAVQRNFHLLNATSYFSLLSNCDSRSCCLSLLLSLSLCRSLVHLIPLFCCEAVLLFDCAIGVLGISCKMWQILKIHNRNIIIAVVVATVVVVVVVINHQKSSIQKKSTTITPQMYYNNVFSFWRWQNSCFEMLFRGVINAFIPRSTIVTHFGSLFIWGFYYMALRERVIRQNNSYIYPSSSISLWASKCAPHFFDLRQITLNDKNKRKNGIK